MTENPGDVPPADDDDLYGVLGVPAGANPDEISRAYRRLAREHHPDANPGADATHFAGLTDAYDVLRDPHRREAYDSTRRTRADAARSARGVRIPLRRIDRDRPPGDVVAPAEPAVAPAERAKRAERAEAGEGGGPARGSRSTCR